MLFLVHNRTNGGQRVEWVARLPKDTNRLAQCFATLLENKAVAGTMGVQSRVCHEEQEEFECPLRRDKRKARQISHLVGGRAGSKY